MSRWHLFDFPLALVAAACAQPQSQPQPVVINNQVNTINAGAARPAIAATAGAQTAQAQIQKRAAPSGAKQRIDSFAALNADCSSMGQPIVQIKAPPSHGTLIPEQGEYFTNFPKENQRYDCNMKKSAGILLYDTSAPGFSGPDSAVVDIVFPAAARGLYVTASRWSNALAVD